MKKIYLIPIVILSGVLVNFMVMDIDKVISRVTNPELPVLKQGWKGNIFINSRFANDTVPDEITFRTFLKWRFSRNPQKKEKESDTFQVPFYPMENIVNVSKHIVWLGHASFLISINGVNIITDPSFYNIPTRDRKVPLPISVQALYPIHYVLVSHDHRDHFDKKSFEELVSVNPDLELLLPLNGSRLLDSEKYKTLRYQEAGWYQEYRLKEDFRIVFLPARHWGRRGMNDQNRTLWGSFIIITPQTTIYFGGDSGYGYFYKEIQELFGDIDICILPIGAYSPSYMMKTSHTTPEEALQAFTDLGGKRFIPMHYGTYDLSDEPAGEPLERLRKQADNLNIKDKLRILGVGEFLTISISEGKPETATKPLVKQEDEKF